MRALLRFWIVGLSFPIAYACGGSSSPDDDDAAGAGGTSGNAGRANAGKAGLTQGAGRSSGGSAGAGKGGTSTGGSSTGGSSRGGAATDGGSGNRAGRGGTGSGGLAGDGAAGEGGAMESPSGAPGSGGSEGGSSGAHGEDAIWDVGSFDTTTNPSTNGFSYGWKATPTGAFTLYPTVSQSLGDARFTWVPAESIAYLMVGYNPTTENLGGDPGMTVFFHPGPSGEMSVIRWICHESRNYRIDATFDPRDDTTTTVTVVRNDTPIFTSPVTAGNPAEYHDTIALEEDDVIDFGVDYGTNANNSYDNTGIALVITAD